MMILLVIVCILASIEAIETEDRVKTYKKQAQNSIQSFRPKKYDIDRKYTAISTFEYSLDTVALIDEDFESGMPAGWTVVDGNNDGHTWTTGTTFDLLYVHPPNYGTAYAYYSDDDAGGAAPAGTEYLISPSISCADATTMFLSYSWGHNLMGLYLQGTAQARFHNGISWKTWDTLATYPYTANGVDTHNLGSYLPAESVQVQFTYEDPLGEWGLAFGIDNVLLEAQMPSLLVWDFETGLQGWTHTNGMAYPAGWDVESSSIHASQTPPSAGDSCMWIDSDAMGFGLWMQDSALSPFCTPDPAMDWMVYGICNYHFGGSSYLNEMHVGIKYEASGVWTAVELAYYGTTAAFGPAWDSVDVSAYATDDHVQPYFYFDDLYTWGYWASFDNVTIGATPYIPDHDVGCTQVLSPPEGSAAPGWYDVIGRVRNFGSNSETFDVMAIVWDTVGWNQVFSQNITMTNFPVSGDSNVYFDTVTFDSNSFYYTEIYTMLPGDYDPSNDTSAIYSRTGLAVSDIVFEMDAQAICNDNQLSGIWFHDEYFVITGGGNAADPNKVYVVDTAGNLVWTMDQPSHSTGWGWRTLFCDYTYTGPNMLGYLYAPYGNLWDRFTIDLQGGVLTYYGYIPAPVPSNCAAYMPDSNWLFIPGVDSVIKCNWTQIIQTAPQPGYYIRDGTYDADTVDGPWIWWHSQDDPGTGYLCQISQMDPFTMHFTDLVSGYQLPAALTDGIAGGLCFYSGFREMDVLFALVQGTPHDFIVGLFVRPYQGPGVTDQAAVSTSTGFGFAPSMATVAKTQATIAYGTTKSGHVSLKIYDSAGRLVRILAQGHEQAGHKTIHWDGKDEHNNRVPSGCYFVKLTAGDNVHMKKIILVK